MRAAMSNDAFRAALANDAFRAALQNDAFRAALASDAFRAALQSDAFRMAMGRKAVSPASGLLKRTIVKWIALHLPLPWPAGIPTSPEIDQEAGGTSPVVFAADVAELAVLVEIFTAPARSFAWQPHPIFGTLSDAAWLRWGYLHMDHHLRQFGA